MKGLQSVLAASGFCSGCMHAWWPGVAEQVGLRGTGVWLGHEAPRGLVARFSQNSPAPCHIEYVVAWPTCQHSI